MPESKWTGFGKQHRHCPNCGQHLYDDVLNYDHVQSLMCSQKCREDWEMKYAAKILGHHAPETQS